MRIFCLITFLIQLIRLGATNNVVCSYDELNSEIKGVVYYCEVQEINDITSPNKAVIQSISGNHKEGKSNDDVHGFNVYEKNIQYFPQNLEKFFKNLKSIVIFKSGMKEMHQSDLKHLTQLQELYLANNNIQVLEEGLFDYNPQLQFISFESNQLRLIHPNVFDNLSKLGDLWLRNNQCIDKGSDEATIIKEIIQEVKVKCSSQQ